MSDALIIPVDSSQVEKGKRSLADLAAQGKKTEQAIDGLGKAGKDSASAISSLASGSKIAAIGIAAVGAGIVGLGASLLNTAIGAEKLNNTLKFSIGSAAGAAREIEYLKTTTNALGLEFQTTAIAYAKFSAASKGTALEGQKTRDIFEAIAKASTVLGLSADETGGALKAIEQIISKGTVSAEELRGQLGERLPGAFEIASRAMGVTTQELGKMLEQGKLVSDVFLPKFAAELTKTLGDNPESAAGSAQAQLNKLSNAWLDFKKAILETGVITIVVKGFETATDTINALKFTLFGEAKKDSIVGRASGFFNPLGETILNSFGIDSASQKAAKKARASSINSSIKFGGNISTEYFYPSFGVTKKEGAGGYDARLNTEINNGNALKKAAKDATDALRKAEEERKRKLEEHFDVLRAGVEAEYAYNESLKEVRNTIFQAVEAEQSRLDNAEREIDVLRIGEKAISEREIAEIRNTIAINESNAAFLTANALQFENNGYVKAAIDAIGDQNKAYEKLIGTKEKNIEADLRLNSFKLDKEQQENRVKADKEANDKIAKQHEELARDINKSLTDGILRSFESGESGFKAFIKNLKNIAKTAAIRLGIDFVLNASGLNGLIEQVSKLISGIGVGGAAGEVLSGKGSGSLFGQLSSIGDIFKSGNASIVSGIESLGTFLSTGNGGLGDLLGGAIGQFSGEIANALPFAGAALSLLTGDIKGAVGAGIGAALSFTPLGPLGGIVGSFIGKALGGLFGGDKLPPRITEARAGTFQNGVFSARESSEKGERTIGASSTFDSINEAFSKSLDSLLSSFGVSQKIGTLSVASKKKNIESGFVAYLDGVVAGNFYQKFKGKTGLDVVIKAISENALGSVLAETIQSSKLSAGVKKFFDGVTKKDDVLNAIGTLASLNKALADLPPVFDAIRNAIDTTAYKTNIDDLKSRFNAVGTYTSLFYTAEEQFNTFVKQLNRQTDSLGLSIPKTREEYRGLVDGIKVVDESSSNLFNGLVALAPAMDAYFKQLEAQKDIADELANGARGQFTSASDYRAYSGIARNYDSQIAYDYVSNLGAGNIGNSATGQTTAGGAINEAVVTLLTELRDYMKQNLSASEGTENALQRIELLGLPVNA
jgi:tape measure domain-containing protein